MFGSKKYFQHHENGDKMERKNLGILVLVLVIVAVSVIVTDKKDAGTKVITLAIAEQKVYVEGYNKVEFESNGETYTLTTNKVGADRKSADFTFMSEFGAIRSDFTLDLTWKEKVTTFREPESERVQTKKSKTIGMNEKTDFYIELVSIEQGKALIIIKSLQK